MSKYPYRIIPFPKQLREMRMIFKRKTRGLFWEMGSGKTKVVLDFIGVMLWNKKISRALVICKLRGIAVWENEITLNMQPDVRYFVLRNSPRPVGWEKAQLFITNYDYARTHFDELKKLAPEVIAVDESHRIKNPQARQSRIAHRLAKLPDSEYRIAMTGTEIGNHILDLWSQFRFIDWTVLQEKFKDFKNEHVIFKGFGGFKIHKYRNVRELAKKIAPYISIEKANTGVKSQWVEVPVDMPPEAKKQYKQMEEEFVTTVDKEVDINAPIVLAKLTKCSQISGGFIRDTETEIDYPLHTAKLEALKEYTDSLLDQGEKRVVIYARFLWELEEIKKTLAPDWVTFTIKGGVTIAEQKLAESIFNESGGAMICQIASGSESLNLQSCRYMIFYSFDYSSINFQQAIKRIDRTGQKAPTCFYYILLCRGTLDRRIYGILRGKKNVLDEVRNLVREIKGERA